MMATDTTPRRVATIELPVHGMDCAGCAKTIEGAIAALPGVEAVDGLRQKWRDGSCRWAWRRS